MELLKPLSPVIPVFLLVALGFAFAHWKKITLASVTDIIVYLGTPSLVLSSLASRPLQASEVAVLFFGVALIYAGVGLLIALYFRIFAFASRGFAVLQPQFRGSIGFGNRLWRAGDGEWGRKMQDDKDDGLAWLVREGIADPQRAIIYGFSYGGFAAMAASVRPNSPYRCAISGAGVSSLQRLGSLWRENRVQRQYQGVTVRGMDPLEHASEASIPILLYHGDRDQTATLWHSERFAAALRGANKPHQFVVIEDMPHGALTPVMMRREHELVEAYIRGPCGITY